MPRSGSLLTGLGGLVLLGWGAAQMLRPSGEDEAPAAGALAPFDASRAGPWEEVARVPAERLGRGNVVALDARGDTLFLLWSTSWLWLHGDSMHGPFGSRIAGDPASLRAGVGLVAQDRQVLILDGARQMLSRWSLDGARGTESPLASADDRTLQHLGFGAADGAAVVVASLEIGDTTAGWHLVRHAVSADGDRTDTLRRDLGRGVPFAAYDLPWFASHGDTITALFAHSARLLSMDAAGRTSRDVTRTDQPRWPMPDSSRRALAKWAGVVPATMLRLLALPPLMPPLRGVTIAPTGERIVLTARGDDAFHVELVDGEGRAIARLWERSEPWPIHLARGAIYRLRDLDDVLVVERQRLRGALP